MHPIITIIVLEGISNADAGIARCTVVRAHPVQLDIGSAWHLCSAFPVKMLLDCF